VLKNLELAVVRNDAIAFVGKNGEGKTTLSKIIVKELDYTGSANLGSNVSIGYFAQNQAELLDPERTVFETIDDVAVGDMRPRIRGLLGSFLFSGDTIYKKVKVLSGGEKSRLAIARMLLSPVNLLVLDEPTNHLDMSSKDILKNALLNYDGTLIIVSHDRDFLQGLTTKVFEFKNNNIRQYIGDIYDFLESRKIESLKELESANHHSKSDKRRSPVSGNKLKYEQRKNFEKAFRRINSRIKKCEENIHKIEQKIETIDKYMVDPEKYANEISTEGIYEKYADLKKELGNAMKMWEKLHNELEDLQK